MERESNLPLWPIANRTLILFFPSFPDVTFPVVPSGSASSSNGDEARSQIRSEAGRVFGRPDGWRNVIKPGGFQETETETHTSVWSFSAEQVENKD